MTGRRQQALLHTWVTKTKMRLPAKTTYLTRIWLGTHIRLKITFTLKNSSNIMLLFSDQTLQMWQKSIKINNIFSKKLAINTLMLLFWKIIFFKFCPFYLIKMYTMLLNNFVQKLLFQWFFGKFGLFKKSNTWTIFYGECYFQPDVPLGFLLRCISIDYCHWLHNNFYT